MNFVPDITLGNALMLLVPVITALGTWFTLKATVANLVGKVGEFCGRLDKTDTHLNTLQRYVDKELVERTELKELEAKLDRRFGDVEHVVRGTAAQVIAALSGADRDALPTRRRRPSA